MPLEMISPTTDLVFGVPRWIVIAFMAVLGAMIGSFLNVVIHRLPREQSIVLPKSACPACGKAIHFYDNIPILSFLILRGRCRSCHAPISPRYPAVEALCALLFALVTWRDGRAGLTIARFAARHAALKHRILYQLQNQQTEEAS